MNSYDVLFFGTAKFFFSKWTCFLSNLPNLDGSSSKYAKLPDAVPFWSLFRSSQGVLWYLQCPGYENLFEPDVQGVAAVAKDGFFVGLFWPPVWVFSWLRKLQI